MSTSKTPLEPLEDLPPDLAELDAELGGLLLEERPSFAPELRSELAREWSRPRVAAGRRGGLRHAVAACLGALAAVGLAVPPARASLAEGLDRILGSLRGPEDVVQEELVVELPRSEAPPLDRDLAESPSPRPVDAVPASDPREEPPPVGATLPPFQPGLFAYPRLLDPSEGTEVALRYYPADLQEAGIGGVVRLHLWVKEDGSVDSPQVSEQGSSGVLELDRAALRAAPALRFRPALRAGVPVSTWVEFDMVFEAPVQNPVVQAPEALETPGIPAVQGWEPPASWVEAAVVPAPIRMEARSLLQVALGDTEAALEERFGPLEGVLSGDPPSGVNPLLWREEVGRALEEARVRDPENAAPYLALARLRRKQGRRDEAQLLFQKGLDRATRGARPVSPRLVAELAYESGRIARERWLGWKSLGEVPTRAMTGRGCPTVVGPGPLASAETLLAWNYSCPAALRDALEEGFEGRPEGAGARATMLAAFVHAVEVFPAHVGANTELLLELADQESWREVLEGSRRFGWASQGHPNARLLEGLALQRLGRTEEAEARFEAALERLEPPVADGFGDLGGVIPELALGRGGAELGVSDPILSTPVDERQVEHLARAAYAFLRFGSLEADAARVWVRYGRPARMRAFGAGPGVRLEFWDYGSGPDLTFHRPTSIQNGTLTTEAEEYLLELASFFPHWYGNAARSVRPLPAQLTRFQGAVPEEEVLRIRLTIPPGLEPGDGGLEVGVFAIGSDHGVEEVVRRSVDAEGLSDLDFTIPWRPGAESVVLELFDPVSRATAAARASVADPLDVASELLLLNANSPSRGVGGRGGAGLDPVADPDRVPDRLGVFAELYDLEPGSRYTLTFELAAPPGSTWTPLSFRRWDGQESGAAARRVAPLEGPVREHVVLDLADVPPGSYTLRMRVETQDGRVLLRERVGVGRSSGDTSGSAVAAPPGL